MSAFTSLNKTKDSNLITSIDEVSSSLTYVGKASIGASTSEAKWQIRRLAGTPPDLDIRFASTGAFDQIWDNRASLSYS